MTRVPSPRTDSGLERRTQYRIDDLAQAAGTTVRNIRAYQDRGLLPPAERRGRSNVYGPAHLQRLRLIAQLLNRGHTLAGIKELLDAWSDGRGLGGVLGLVAEVTGPWTDELPERLCRADLRARFGGVEDAEALAAAVRLGVLEPESEAWESFLVPNPAVLGVAARLFALGVPLQACLGHLESLRADVEGMARDFVEFSALHVFARYAGHALTDEEAAEAAASVRELRPLAQQVVNAELARALRAEAVRLLDSAVPPHLRDVLAREL
ncbi:MerR family transcriptional regulator [Streptacidiphilus monticola]|uniref:MerR family transcriptional regulator n=1 Tax=Streptacidiphilus monticola TaxID=2161674 RepID=A0ABW1G3N4_9ACTN